MSEFLEKYRDLSTDHFESCWEAPSNIAFVKYWGKKAHQIPANPSLSMTLNECRTTTKTKFAPADSLSVSLKLDGMMNEKFALKIRDYLSTLKVDLPLIQKLSVSIETSNTFPHGAGIASSASGLAAFALTLCDYLNHLNPENNQYLFYKRASYLSRLASGSACRSVFGGYASWGESELFGSTDLFATPMEVHPECAVLKDTILVISGKEKNISSRAGHERMTEHFFAESRFAQAKHHFTQCVSGLRSGDLEAVGKILEAEALSLHAMMMTSPNPYTLLKPNTLAAIDAVWNFRRETKIPLFFTLDAGPNLHLIYPDAVNKKIDSFISSELKPLCEKILFDKTGEGPSKC
jgi:diphosphomevalonate decarboxylase